MLKCSCSYSNAADIPEPKTYAEAMTSEHAAEWQHAMDKEMSSLLQQGTWEKVEVLAGQHILLLQHRPTHACCGVQVSRYAYPCCDSCQPYKANCDMYRRDRFHSNHPSGITTGNTA